MSGSPTGLIFKCHSLWTGSANAAPPGGWYEDVFDDSAWAGPSTAHTASGEQTVPFTIPQWTAPDPASATEQALFRTKFDIPSGVIAFQIKINVADSCLGLYFNGARVDVGVGDSGTVAQWWGIPIALLHQGGTNVLAIYAANVSGGSAYVSYGLIYYTQDDTGTTANDAGAGNTGTSGLDGSYGTYLGTGVTGSGPTLRARLASGCVGWEHDGTLWRVRSGGHTVLQTPFPQMSAQPAAVLGRDPLTGLPMWSGLADSAPPPPPPPAVSRTYHTPDLSIKDTGGAADPLPIPPDAERICGAADMMAARLCLIYNGIVQVINAVRGNIIASFTRSLKNLVKEQIVSLLTEAEFGLEEIDGIQIALDILGAIVQTLLDWGTRLPLIQVPDPGVLGVGEFQILRCQAYRALRLTGGDYLSESKSADGTGTRDYWMQYLAPQWSFFAGSTIGGISETNPPWQLVWLDNIIKSANDLYWAKAAWAGAQRPSTVCTGCAGYP